MNNHLQRFRDFALLILILPVLLPLFSGVVLLTLIRDGRPIFYSQKRIGLNGKSFEILKIRTMLNDTRLVDDLRITRNGHFLREWSLDELPQIINVLRGEMSLIGPRPLLWTYKNELLCETDQIRHSIRPGITGWAQINGRNELSWSEKLIYDQWYVKKQSFLFDIYILLRTLPVWLKKEGIYTKDGKMMPDLKITSPKEKLNQKEQITFS
jgi:sugar transferase EpsL